MRQIIEIDISGDTEGDLEAALNESTRLIREGFTSGHNANDTGSFSFDVSTYEDSDDETEAEVSSADGTDLASVMSVEFIEASDLTRDYAWGPEFWSVISASAPFSWGDNNRTLVTASRFLDHIERCSLDDCMPSEELGRLVEKLEALGETYIDLEN